MWERIAKSAAAVGCGAAMFYGAYKAHQLRPQVASLYQ